MMSQSVKIITFPKPKQIHKKKLILSLGREVPDYWSCFDVMILEVQECSIKHACRSSSLSQEAIHEAAGGHTYMRLLEAGPTYNRTILCKYISSKTS